MADEPKFPPETITPIEELIRYGNVNGKSDYDMAKAVLGASGYLEREATVKDLVAALKNVNVLIDGERANLVLGKEEPAPWGGSQRWGYSLGIVDTKAIKLWLAARDAALRRAGAI